MQFFGYPGSSLMAFQRNSHYHPHHGMVPDFYLQILAFNADVNIVWLCSNDFDIIPSEYDNSYPTFVFKQFKQFMEHICWATGSWPVVLDVLNRPRPSRGLTSDQYHHLAQRFNDKWEKKYARRLRLQRDIQKPENFHQDGVHLTRSGYHAAACHIFQFALNDVLQE